jgi:hypothetical protein
MLFLRILKYIFLVTLPAILFIYLLIYSFLYFVSVQQMIKSANLKAPREIIESRKRRSYSAEEFNLIKEKAELSSRLKMAESDSIGLAIDLSDSTVQLEMKGVVLKKVKFSNLKYDGFFTALHPAAYQSVFSKPFVIQRIEGASEKEPLTIKKAPKDTIEAAAQPGPEKIDTTKFEFIEWHMILNNNITVSVVQSDSEKGRWNKENTNYRRRRYYSALKTNTLNVLHLKKFVYHPEITIYIPSGQAKSFYRALPERGDVRLKI